MPMRTFKILVVAPLVFAVCGVGLSAQQPQPGTPSTTVPRVVRISGTFHPADGQPPQPVEAVTLSIYGEQSGQTPLWQETQSVTVAADGRYSILMGASLPDGIPLDLFGTTDPRWLGVQFTRPGESEQPRTQLVSVVFALKAADAETLGGRPAAAYLLAPTEQSQNAGVTGTANLTTTSGHLSSTSRQMRSSTSPLLTNSMTTDAMNVVFTDTSGSYTGYSVQNLGSGVASYSGMLFYDQNGALGQFQGFNNSTHEYRINNIAKTGASYDGSINFMIGSSSKFLVAPSGNIGIGTTTPSQKLDVAGDINFSGMLRYVGSQAVRLGGSYAGGANTGVGIVALSAVTTGIRNTALGYHALTATTSNDNTAVGAYALLANTGGYSNTAVGSSALGNATAVYNTAVGAFAGAYATTGSYNTLVGYEAGGSSQVSGDSNTAVGYGAGLNLTSGGTNIMLGTFAGSNLTTLSNNIDIGNYGTASDVNTIRIGTTGIQTATYVAGIRNVTTGLAAIPVLVDSNGQLGTVSSSRTVKRDIENMGDTTGTVMALRPVRFRYIAHGPDGPEQYGLVAEEVAEVAPDLVAHKPDGAIETVYYDKVNAMLLNEVQKLHRQVESQKAEAAAQVAAQDARIRELEARLEALASRKQ